jgi:Carbohydrate binding domain.
LKQTTNFNFKKPDTTDFYSVDDFNGNMDILDTQLKELDDDHEGHVNNKNNPHAVTKAQIGLGNVDNTSDLDKPVSTAVSSQLAQKVTKGEESGINLFSNSGFQVCQDGKSFTLTTGGAYTADMWQVGTNSTNDTVNIVDNYMKMTSNAAERYYMQQKYELNESIAAELSGKTVTLSFYVKADAAFTAKTCYTRSTDSAETTIQTYNITTTWTKREITFAMPSLTSAMAWIAFAIFRIDDALKPQLPATNIYIKEPKLELGNHATAYVPSDISIELEKSQRKYEKSYQDVSNSTQFYADTATSLHGGAMFKVEKRVAPTISILNNKVRKVDDGSILTITDCIISADVKGIKYIYGITGATLTPGKWYSLAYTADARL